MYTYSQKNINLTVHAKFAMNSRLINFPFEIVVIRRNRICTLKVFTGFKHKIKVA